MTTPSEHLAGLKIGTVEYVASNEVRVTLELDAPQATALNTGVPTGFPRLNGYVLIPNESGALVGMVSWLGIERSPFPKRRGLKDFDLVDLPFPVRKMALTPLGTLCRNHNSELGEYAFSLERGVRAFPSVGDTVLLPSAQQVEAIVASHGTDRRVAIGVSPLAHNATIAVDPDKVFGRHLAVLGNTGSGKSCSVAGLIRWSIDAAAKQREEQGRAATPANARFILLDPNGEYAHAFEDYGDRVRMYQVQPTTENAAPLRVPAWLWNSQEWSTFASASPGVQRPLLLQALRDMRASRQLEEPVVRKIERLFKGYRRRVEQALVQGPTGYQGFPQNKNFGAMLENITTDAESYVNNAQLADEELRRVLGELQTSANQRAEARHWESANSSGYNDFAEADVEAVREAIDAVIENLPEVGDESLHSEDAPIRFDVTQLADHLEHIAANEQSVQAAQFVGTLTMRLRMLLADSRKRPVLVPEEQPTLIEWLEEYLGKDQAANGELAILDLSLVPSDVLATVIAVLSRLVFESLQRYRRANDKPLPTVLVLEEAHTFIQRSSGEQEGTPTPTQTCREVFERIAREGRKFGLGLVLSSQRPSELSPTVLAQCNTFLLHRLVNDRDQELVRKLIPDTLGGLLGDLPSLPTRYALLLGWATPLPVLVEMSNLPEKFRPRSQDPDFWDVWVGDVPRSVDWSSLANAWTQEGVITEEAHDEDDE